MSIERMHITWHRFMSCLQENNVQKLFRNVYPSQTDTTQPHRFGIGSARIYGSL